MAPMKKKTLENQPDLPLTIYQLSDWAKFRGDHKPLSCICDEAGNIIGLIIKNTDRTKITLPDLPQLAYCCISDNEKLESLAFQGDLSNLKHLDVSDNQLKELEIPTNLSQLEYLYAANNKLEILRFCLLYTSPSPRDATLSRMPSSA